jgi:hypothetical protein
MQNNFYGSSSYNFSNFQHVNLNSHASATPEIHMPMNNMMSSTNQYETLDVGNASRIQASVSPLYSLNNSQYAASQSNKSMDREIGHANTSYLVNYPQPSYATLHANNFTPQYATS